ncbi:hypothetical protein EC880221_3708, partial [Escherichia coli 88.0221]
ILRVN